MKKKFDENTQLDIRAHDLGQPPLSTVATLYILVDQTASPLNGNTARTVAPSVTAGFSEMAYSVSVSEDALINTLIKNLSVVVTKQSGDHHQPDPVGFTCDIASGNEMGKSWNKMKCF